MPIISYHKNLVSVIYQAAQCRMRENTLKTWKNSMTSCQLICGLDVFVSKPCLLSGSTPPPTSCITSETKSPDAFFFLSFHVPLFLSPFGTNELQLDKNTCSEMKTKRTNHQTILNFKREWFMASFIQFLRYNQTYSKKPSAMVVIRGLLRERQFISAPIKIISYPQSFFPCSDFFLLCNASSAG